MARSESRSTIGEQTAEADRGRHPGFPSFNVRAGGPGSLVERSAHKNPGRAPLVLGEERALAEHEYIPGQVLRLPTGQSHRIHVRQPRVVEMWFAASEQSWENRPWADVMSGSVTVIARLSDPLPGSNARYEVALSTEHNTNAEVILDDVLTNPLPGLSAEARTLVRGSLPAAEVRSRLKTYAQPGSFTSCDATNNLDSVAFEEAMRLAGAGTRVLGLKQANRICPEASSPAVHAAAPPASLAVPAPVLLVS